MCVYSLKFSHCTLFGMKHSSGFLNFLKIGLLNNYVNFESEAVDKNSVLSEPSPIESDMHIQ